MNLINYQDGRPIYEQICDYYKNLILRGALVQGDRMPSVRSLAMDLSTNPNTVQRAYQELERQGFIYTVPGKGGFVAGGGALLEQKRTELVAQIRALLQEAKELGLDPASLLREAGEDHD